MINAIKFIFFPFMSVETHLTVPSAKPPLPVAHFCRSPSKVKSASLEQLASIKPSQV